MRILFVHEVNYQLKPIYEVQEFAEYLACRDHDVAFLHFGEGSAPKDNSRYGRGRRLGLGPGVKLHAMPEILPGIVGRLFAAVAAVFWLPYMLRKISPDVVVNYAVPTFGWQVVLAANAMRIPILYRAIDLPDKIRTTAFSPLVKLAERVVAKRSDWVSANNPALLSHCIGIGARPDRSSVNLPYIDFSAYQSGSRKSGRDLLNLPEDEKVILFLGTFFNFSGLDQVIGELKARPTSGCKLVLVGGGKLEPKLRRIVQKAELQDLVLFQGFVPFEQVPAILAAADVLINPMQPLPAAQFALPNKLIQYVASGRPTVSTRLMGAEQVLAASDRVHWVDTAVEAISTAIRLTRTKKVQPQDPDHDLSERFGSLTISEFEELIFRLTQGRS